MTNQKQKLRIKLHFLIYKVVNVYYIVIQKTKPNKFYPRKKKSFLNFRMQVVTFVFEGNADVVI